MLLAIDVGNSTVKITLFDGSEISCRWRLSTDRAITEDDAAVKLGWLLAERELSFGAITRVVVCSVVPALTPVFASLARRLSGSDALVVGPRVDTGLRLGDYDRATLGADRLANLVAAHRLYGSPAVVVDCGTATNFEVLAGDGTFLGGVIAPGLLTAFEGLASRAAQIHAIELTAPDHAIGLSTAGCLQSGVVLGHVALVEGMLSRISLEMQEQPRVIGTGGLIQLVASHTRAIDALDIDLTAHGLRLLSDLNQR